LHPFVKSLRSQRGSGVVKAVLCTMIGGLLTSVCSYVFFTPSGSHTYAYHDDKYHGYPSDDTATYDRYKADQEQEQLTERMDPLNGVSFTTPSINPSHLGVQRNQVLSSRTETSQLAASTKLGSVRAGLSRFGESTHAHPSEMLSSLHHRHRAVGKSSEEEGASVGGGDVRGNRQDTAEQGASSEGGGGGHPYTSPSHHPVRVNHQLQGARPEDLHQSGERVQHHNVGTHNFIPTSVRQADRQAVGEHTGGGGGSLDLLAVRRTCPPIFEGPDCKVCARQSSLNVPECSLNLPE
jgi:hypothetical protein